MVKVVQAYNFPKQSTYSVFGEILAATLIGADRIAVSSAGHFVEIYDIGDTKTTTLSMDADSRREPSPPKYSLPTVGEVVDLIYNDAGKYLVTLEKDNINCPLYGEGDKMFVRVYPNFWKFPEEKLIDYPITIRIASMTTPKLPLVDSLDLIELPLRNPPEMIECCQSSGNIIVASKDRLSLYEYMTCTHETHRFTYVDFLPFKFFVSLNFVPLKISLCENVIACLNKMFVVAFKIVDIVAMDADEDADSNSNASHLSKMSGGQSSNNSFETDSLETCSRIGFNGTPVDFNVARIVNSACGREFEMELKSQWEQEDTNTRDINIVPTRASDIKIKLISEAKAMNVAQISTSNKDDFTVQYDIKKLLQLCMKSTEPSHRIMDILKCMDLKPIYQRMPENENNENLGHAMVKDSHPTNTRSLKSNMYQFCVGYSLLIATSVDGYLYQFCAQGKWYNDNEKPIATYSFTAPVIKVHINDFVIHAITTESVETHTSRVGHKLFANRFEYPTVSSMFPEESSPDIKASISVIGLCSFINVQFVCIARKSLVLISNSLFGDVEEFGGKTKKRNVRSSVKGLSGAMTRSSGQNVINEWTLYKLTIPSVGVVVDDLENIAIGYKTSSPHTFYELMEEAHVMLRQSNCLQFNFFPDERRMLQEKFAKNCRSLADFSIRSCKKEVYVQATGFYKMCNVLPADIYTNFIDELKAHKDMGSQSEQVFVGLIYTVKLFLLSLGVDRSKASYLYQGVTSYFGDRNKEISLALEFLDMFIKYSPNDIPTVMLGSPVVSDIISAEIQAYLSAKNKLSSEEMLLLAVCACRSSNFELSRQVIAQSKRKALATALIGHKNVLFDDQYSRDNGIRSSFSDFTENVLMSIDRQDLIEAISDAFIHALCIEHSISLETLLTLFLNYIATHIGVKGYHTSQKVFVNALQVYFYDIYDVSPNTNHTKSKISEEYSSQAISLNEDSVNSEGSHIIFEERRNSVNVVWEPQARIPNEADPVVDINGSDSANGSLVDMNTSDANLKGLKILFRIYLGQLKAITENSDYETMFKTHEHSPETLSIRTECLKFIARHTEALKQVHCQQSTHNTDRLCNGDIGKFIPFIPDYKTFDENSDEPFLRPVACLNDRPSYLNHLKPFGSEFFSKPEEGEQDVHFLGWGNEALCLTLKIQSLLASPKSDPEIIEEFVAFVQKTPNLIGIDSFLIISLPKTLSINYLIHFSPETLWRYGKSHGFAPKQWETLLRKIVSKENVLPNWKTHITDILNNLVEEFSFEELLQCFPPEATAGRTELSSCNQTDLIKERHLAMDNIDESNVFEVTLRRAVSKQRSLALRSMIESTGSQLFDATNNPLYNLN
ncbi:uncharacterized protein LOC129945939 [Eupeodes corollae]|uniref:uncharacterized protein LOC129945939 n=1 Tax=Eupeodes corollae TaxID=290404 RepID=UPI002491B9AD|nr:uncharacterized protein LOC129945939 [Eupeodes corollae]